MKTNIAELLKDCPKGMELDCTMFDNVYFERIDENVNYPIVIGTRIDYKHLTKEGCWDKDADAKCVIFPKGKTTWEGFQKPFKDGDILAYTSSHTTVFIYRNKDNEPNFSTSFYVACNNAPSHNFLIYNKHALIALNGNCDVRYATEEEKQELFQTIKANGYKWDAETKTLEKLINPKFKVGDKVREKGDEAAAFTISDIDDSRYYCGKYVICNICDQEFFELVPNKFDITTLKAFESKVLVRDYDNQIWIPTFWGKYLEDDSNCRYLTTNGCYKYCIPYENNQHLLGTTNDCDDFYKTWKK